MRDKQLKTIAAQNQRLTTKGKANALDMLDVATNARMRPYSLVIKTTKRSPKEIEQYEANRKKVLKGAAYVGGAMALAGGLYFGSKGLKGALNARNDRTLTRNGIYNVITMGTRKFTPFDASTNNAARTIFVPAPFKSSSNWKAPQHGPRGTLAIGR
jgi:glutamate 5-kinase